MAECNDTAITYLSLYIWIYQTRKERRARTKNNLVSFHFSARTQQECHVSVALVFESGEPVIGERGRINVDGRQWFWVRIYTIRYNVT